MASSETSRQRAGLSAGEIEAAFLAGVEGNIQRARGGLLAGSWWTTETRSEEYRLRQWVRSRDELNWLPKNKRVIVTGWRRTWWLGKRPRSRAIASVLSLLERHARDDEDPPPIGLVDLKAHVEGLVGDEEMDCYVGVCSPSGFTEEARQLIWPKANVRLVLIEPGSEGTWEGTWRVTGAGRNVHDAVLALFDPEGERARIERVRQEIEARAAELVAGGLRDRDLAAALGVSPAIVARAMKLATQRDPALKLSTSQDGCLLYRGAPADEESTMSMMDRIRQLLSGEGNEVRKINLLSERRAKLVEQRDKLYTDIAALEGRERELLKEGRDTTSPSVKKRVATQIKHLRDEMERMNAKARVLGRQVEVISTHVHNLTLIRQGKAAKLPTHEELTQDAVRAEEMLERLTADADLATGLDTGAAESSLSEEEAAILAELEQPAGETAAEAPESDMVDDIVRELDAEPPQERTKPREPEAG